MFRYHLWAVLLAECLDNLLLCIASSIGLSTLVALSLAPALCSTILKSEEEKPDFVFIQKFDEWFNKNKRYLSCAYKNICRVCRLNFRGSWFSCTVNNRIIFINPERFLPAEDRGALFTQVQLPAGSSAARSDEVSKDIEARLLKIPGIKDTIALVGLNGENTAFIVSNLEPWSKRKKERSIC